LLARSPRLKDSSDRAMTESALRCCLHISSVSCGSAACDCAGRAGLNSSSRWQRSLRTSAGWPSSWHGRLRSRPHARRERQVTPKSRWQSLEWSPATALRASGRLSFPGANGRFLFGDFCNKIGTKRTYRSACYFVRFRGDCVAKVAVKKLWNWILK
jgi:hypothetical protein